MDNMIFNVTAYQYRDGKLIDQWEFAARSFWFDDDHLLLKRSNHHDDSFIIIFQQGWALWTLEWHSDHVLVHRTMSRRDPHTLIVFYDGQVLREFVQMDSPGRLEIYACYPVPTTDFDQEPRLIQGRLVGDGLDDFALLQLVQISDGSYYLTLRGD